MTKTTKQIIVAVGCAIFIIGLAFFLLGNSQEVPAMAPEVEPIDIIDGEVEQEPSKPEISVPAIEPDNKTPDVIPDPADEQEVYVPDVIETKTEDGGTLQTPNWEAQRELKEGTDLTDQDTTPEYKEEHPNNKKDEDTSPKGGDQANINSDEYIYVDGFGWVKYGGENIIVNDHSDLELTGNKIGY